MNRLPVLSFGRLSVKTEDLFFLQIIGYYVKAIYKGTSTKKVLKHFPGLYLSNYEKYYSGWWGNGGCGQLGG